MKLNISGGFPRFGFSWLLFRVTSVFLLESGSTGTRPPDVGYAAYAFVTDLQLLGGGPSRGPGCQIAASCRRGDIAGVLPDLGEGHFEMKGDLRGIHVL